MQWQYDSGLQHPPTGTIPVAAGMKQHLPSAIAGKERMNQKTINEPLTYENATGEITYTLTSDLLFHYVMQKSQKALMGLVCALEGIDSESVKSVEVLNPIDLNSYGKETIMDLKLLFNSGKIMNIELQMYTDKFWIARSLLYLCRAYDSLDRSDDYSKLKPTTHFCITNQELFPEYPEFYARFLLLNAKNHQPYTKNFGINVLQLNHINLATKEDIQNNLVYWAKLFNATTWEEFRALANNNDSIKEVGDLIFTLNTDNQAKEILEGQRRYREQMASQYTAGFTDCEEKLNPIIKQKDEIIAEMKARNAEMETRNAEMDNTIAEKDNTIAEKDNTIAEMKAHNTEIEARNAEMEAQIARLTAELSKYNHD